MDDYVGIFHVKNCCCCINPRVGSLIIGYLQLFVQSLYIIGLILAIVGLNNASYVDVDGDPASDGYLKTVAIMLYVMVAILFVNVVLALLLVVGIHKEKPILVRSYLIYQTVSVVFIIIYFILTLILLYTNILNIIQLIIHIALSIYYLMVIKSYYLVMKNNVGAVAP